MALGPREKSELELHWQHQRDHVRADVKNIYRRAFALAEARAFQVIAEEFNASGTLVDLRAHPGELEEVARKALTEATGV